MMPRTSGSFTHSHNRRLSSMQARRNRIPRAYLPFWDDGGLPLPDLSPFVMLCEVNCRYQAITLTEVCRASPSLTLLRPRLDVCPAGGVPGKERPPSLPTQKFDRKWRKICPVAPITVDLLLLGSAMAEEREFARP